MARVFFGLVFFLSGLDLFFGVMPGLMPRLMPMPEGQEAFLGALAETGYLWRVVKAAELLGGLALLAGYFVPLGLTVLAPVGLNIFLFQLFLGSPLILPFDVLLLGAGAFLAWAYRGSFRGVLRAKATPSPTQ